MCELGIKNLEYSVKSLIYRRHSIFVRFDKKYGDSVPQASGRSFLTAVVLISAKNAPLCTLRKWDR